MSNTSATIKTTEILDPTIMGNDIYWLIKITSGKSYREYIIEENGQWPGLNRYHGQRQLAA